MNTQSVTSRGAQYAPPPVDGDFYKITGLLCDGDRSLVERVRAFMDAEVAPLIEDYWARDKFPHEIVPRIAALGIGGVM